MAKKTKTAPTPPPPSSVELAAFTTATPPQPNLRFVGKVPVTTFDIDGATITLPKDQSEPFYHEQAVLIAQRLPNYYQMCSDCGCGK